MNGYYVDVVKSGNDIGFTAETSEKLSVELAVCSYIWKQYFDGDVS
jgi:hypothetical protein